MKKIFLILLSAVLLLSAGCGAQQPEPTEAVVPETTVPATQAPAEAPTEPPTEPVPVCVEALVQVADAPAILLLLNRGDSVDVVGEFDEQHYVVKTEQGYGLVEKQLLRFSGETAYEVWTGYTYSGAEVYSNYQFIGDPVATLGLNTQVEVLDELEYGYVVKTGEVSGFIPKESLSRNRIQYKSGGGGSQDGGDISLNFGGVVKLSVIEQTGEVTGQAEVLADGTQVILGYFQMGDCVSVVSEEGFAPAWEGYHTLYLDGFYAYMPMNLALASGEEAYTQWSGYSGYSACVYDTYLLLGESVALATNTQVTVLWGGGDYYVVSIGDDIGYMAVEKVGESRYATGGGGGGGGGDWTPPAL